MRSCGILMHITSLPSPYGIGTFGSEAEAFVDYLVQSGQHYWQVLPIGPTGYGDSPYQSFSTYAGNPLLIDLDDLVQSGMIPKQKCLDADFGADPTFVDFEKVYRTKMELLNIAYKNFSEDVGYLAFLKEEAGWIEDYALFMAIKEENGLRPWLSWDEGLKHRERHAIAEKEESLVSEIGFWKFLQYTFFRQWTRLKRYANKNGIQIIGDIPIYVAMDSADTWANTDLFLLDNDCNPTNVAGVPPDYFSETGQLWGNPIYDWKRMKSENYLWWITRIRKAATLYDIVRIDHFRGFDTYYSIPYGELTAVKGKWEKGPGMDLFNEIKKQLGDVNIIAEDLGELFDSVIELLKASGFPGMKVLQFAFNDNDEDNNFLPHHYQPNSVAYTGTHDNDTLRGWFASASKATASMAKRYVKPGALEGNFAYIRVLYQSAAGLVIIPMQDVLELGTEARMNIPSTIGGNWKWRMKKGANDEKLSSKLKGLTETYFR